MTDANEPAVTIRGTIYALHHLLLACIDALGNCLDGRGESDCACLAPLSRIEHLAMLMLVVFLTGAASVMVVWTMTVL